MAESLESTLCSLSIDETDVPMAMDERDHGESASDYSVRSGVFDADNLGSTSQDAGPSDDTAPSFHSANVDERFMEPLYSGAGLSVFESYSLLLKYSLRHALTKKAFSDLLQLVGAHLPTQSMASLYKVKKFFMELYGDITFKLYYCCSICHCLLEDDDEVCPQECNGETLEFLSIPISNQLKRRIEDPNTWKHLQRRFERERDPNQFSDVYDGQEYKKHADFLSKSENVSFLLNTDGVSIFRSSTVSLWPLWLVINELPPIVRFSKDNMLLAGLWFSREKPTMTSYLQPLMKELKKLADKGISANTPFGLMTCRARMLMCSVDLPARAQLLNMKQFNGKQGCVYCEDEGTPRATSHLHRNWPYSSHPVLRSHAKMKDDAGRAAENGEAVCGIKGASILCAHKPFKLPVGVVVDVMHCIFLGVIVNLMTLWFGVGQRGQPYSIRNKQKQCDERLLTIKVPHDFSRVVRGIGDIKHWKASEYRSWVLYYSLPVLHGILTEPYYTHYCLLVAALHILLSSSITGTDLQRARAYLDRFYKEFATLYGQDGCTMNVHLLCHMSDCVENWGPMWCYSCFPFESVNGKLKTHYHGTRVMNKQLAFSYIMLQLLPRRAETQVNRTNLGDCVALGRPQLSVLSTDVRDAVRDGVGLDVPRGRKFFRIQVGSKVYHSLEYERVKRRNSYTIVYTKDGEERYGLIRFFLSLPTGTVAVLSPLNSSSNFIYPTQLSILRSRVIPVVLEVDIIVVCVSCLVDKCVNVNLPGCMCIARLPNGLLTD